MSGQRVLFVSAPHLQRLAESLDALVGSVLEGTAIKVVAIRHFEIDHPPVQPDGPYIMQERRSAVVLVETELVCPNYKAKG